jgi:hypothetical protein
MTQTNLPPPPPALWAPRTRNLLNRWLTRMDRRKARHLAGANQTAVDWYWHRAYTEWWHAHGWHEGARTPDQAWNDMMRSRKGTP